jgi:hypothetical protein
MSIKSLNISENDFKSPQNLESSGGKPETFEGSENNAKGSSYVYKRDSVEE